MTETITLTEREQLVLDAIENERKILARRLIDRLEGILAARGLSGHWVLSEDLKTISKSEQSQ